MIKIKLCFHLYISLPCSTVAPFPCSLSVFDLQEKLARLSQDALKDALGVTSRISFDLVQEEGRGDFTTNVALRLAKEAGRKPQEIAKILVDALSRAEGIASCDVAGPGYVNVTLQDGVLVELLSQAHDLCLPQETRAEPPVIVEYSDPNVAKPLGIHHILATVIGQAIANLHRHRGIPTVAINHIGDWGTQFGQLAVAMEKWGSVPVEECSLDDLLALYVRFHTEAERDPALLDQGREAFLRLEKGDEALRSFWKSVIDITMKAMESVYERLHVSFDHVQGESFYQDMMEAIVREAKEKNVFKPGKDGALIVEFPEETKIPPAVALKGDGSTIYLTRDIATVRYRIDTWNPSAILYVVDVAQQLYFRQVFGTVEQMQWDLPALEHVVFGRMRFADKSMSTRKGNILKLEEVLDEAVKRAEALIAEKSSDLAGDEREDLKEMMGVGSVVYGVLSQNRKMDMVFDWDKMLTFEGNSAPYIQYTHARTLSVLRKSKEGTETDAYGDMFRDLAANCADVTASERALIHELLRFHATVAAACEERMPHKLCTYLYGLCQSYNAFYNTESILNAEGSQRSLRLALTALTARTIKAGAGLLTLRVPDRM